MFKIKTKKYAGLTLVETIITIAIVSIIMLGFTFLFGRLWRVYGFTMETGIATFIASQGVDTTVEHIRSARQSENGSFPLISADDNEFVFFSDYDDDGVVERVRYFAENQSLKVGIIEPNLEAFPVTYDASETIKILSEDVVNDVVINANVCNQYSLSSVIDGTAGNPFTSIGMARNISLASEYNFSLGGNNFSTQVTSDGWVLMASGDRDTNEDYYNTTNDLSYADDAILSSSVMSSLGNLQSVRIQAANGSNRPFDVSTEDSGVMNRLKAFQTLGYNNATDATWTGDGASRMGQSGSGPDDSPSGWDGPCQSDLLDEHLYFACNNSSGFIWSHGYGPSTNVNLLKEEAMRNNTDNDLNLFVRAVADSTTFNTIATRQLDDSFLGTDGATYTETQLQNLDGLCTEADVPLDRPVFEYYTDFSGSFDVLSDGENFEYGDIYATALPTPVTDIADINLVKILLHVNPEPLLAPENIKIQSFVNIRNLSTYDTTSR